MPEEQPQGYGQTFQQRGFDPSIYRPVSMGGLKTMPTAQKAGSIGVGSRVLDQEKGNPGEIIAVERNTRVCGGRPQSYILSLTMRTDAGEEYQVRRSALKLIMPEPSEQEAAIDPALARIVEMLNKPSTSCGSPISKRPSSPRNKSAPGLRLAHQAVSPRRNKSTPARQLQSTSSHRPRGACILSAPSQPSPLQGTWPAGGAASHQHQAENRHRTRVQPQPQPNPPTKPPPRT